MDERMARAGVCGRGQGAVESPGPVLRAGPGLVALAAERGHVGVRDLREIERLTGVGRATGCRVLLPH